MCPQFFSIPWKMFALMDFTTALLHNCFMSHKSNVFSIFLSWEFWIIEMSLNYHCLSLDKHLESDTICFVKEGYFNQEAKEQLSFFVVVFAFNAAEKNIHFFGDQKCKYCFVLFNAYFFLVGLACFGSVVCLYAYRWMLVIAREIWIQAGVSPALCRFFGSLFRGNLWKQGL